METTYVRSLPDVTTMYSGTEHPHPPFTVQCYQVSKQKIQKYHSYSASYWHYIEEWSDQTRTCETPERNGVTGWKEMIRGFSVAQGTSNGDHFTLSKIWRGKLSVILHPKMK
jgi:hypothetical protein